MLFTLKDIVDFCYANKRKRAFKNHDYNDVARKIIWADEKHFLHYIESADHASITGVVIAEVHHAARTIFIHEIVGLRGAMAELAAEAFRRYPNFKIQGQRNGITKTFTKENLWVAQDQHNIQAKTPQAC